VSGATRPRPSRAASAVWAGIDVGGPRKGFHVALVDGRRVIDAPRRLVSAAAVLEYLAPWRPIAVGIDSPRRLAVDGQRSRPCERDFVAARICALRYTPDRRGLSASPVYYSWIANGLALWQALEAAGVTALECFPTASWTRWYRPRARTPRATWSTRALMRRRLDGVSGPLDQDERDAIGAALTAYEWSAGRCETFGDIIVPVAPPRAMGGVAAASRRGGR